MLPGVKVKDLDIAVRKGRKKKFCITSTICIRKYNVLASPMYGPLPLLFTCVSKRDDSGVFRGTVDEYRHKNTRVKILRIGWGHWHHTGNAMGSQ